MHGRYILYIFFYLIQRRVINLKRVRQPKQTYGMKAHVVQQVEDELLNIHGDFSLSGAHGRGVNVHLRAVLLQRSLLRWASFYQHDVGRP